MTPSSLFSRRNVLVFFGAAAASFGLGYVTRRLTRRPGTPPIDWRAAFEAKSGQGEAEVKSLVGEGFAGMERLALGDKVPSGQHIRVGKDGVMVLALPDRTVMKINGEAQLELHIDPRSGGVYNLALGAVLSVVPARNLYLAIGPATTVGIKGTVFFREVQGTQPRMMMGMDGMMPMPEGITDYWCTCHGDVDFLGNLQRGEVVRTDHARHHNSFFLKGQGSELKLIKAPMLDHFDDDIQRLIDIQEPPRHDASWLELDHASRPGG